MDRTDDKKEKGKRKSGSDSLLLRTLHGKLFSTEFLTAHWKTILLAMGMIIFFIYNKYTCKTKIETSIRLEEQLDVVRSEFVRERSTYMSRTRESGMQGMVDSLHLDLQVQTIPPYPIKYQ